MRYRILTLTALLTLTAWLLISCNQGDDLSQPLPEPGPVEEWSFQTTGLAILSEDTTFAVEYWEDLTKVETEFYVLLNDTIYLKGSQFPGGQMVMQDDIFSPAYPEVGTSWSGPGSNLYTVDSFTEVTVPAGTFDAYFYSVNDGTTGQFLGTLVLAEDTGILSMVQVDGDDTTRSIVLDDVTFVDGEGVFPLGVGNRWELIEGVYETNP
ncbi:hypothetical protein KKA00_13290 [bacterium]|nr:hypothetical protein [bacterium]MBU1653191.1 hypothetical protein [bacterium]MBU1882279.1 hypothetical protein [bacterium]